MILLECRALHSLIFIIIEPEVSLFVILWNMSLNQNMLFQNYIKIMSMIYPISEFVLQFLTF